MFTRIYLPFIENLDLVAPGEVIPNRQTLPPSLNPAALLKCAMPVFEGLLPGRHNEIILDLLFELAVWHAFAKLRIHTDETLDLFQASTKTLTAAM